MISSAHIGEFLVHRKRDFGLNPNGVTLIVGGNGCLRGDTPIHDPTDGTYLTVAERHSRAVPFHVWALSDSGPVIAPAFPPMQFPREKMLRVVLRSGESVVVTPAHRFWGGQSWLTAALVADRLISAEKPVLLPSISGTDLSALAPNAPRLLQIAPGFPAGCHREYRSCGGPLLGESSIFQGPAPSPSDVPEHSPHLSSWDALDSVTVRSHAYRRGAPPSRICSSPIWGLCVESCPQRAVSPPTHARCCFAWPMRSHQETVAPHTAVALPCTLFLSTLCRVSPRATMVPHGPIARYLEVVQVIPEAEDVYYDFHVPVLNNYWACGVWHHNSGKTSLVQAIVWAIWGKKFRALSEDTSVLLGTSFGPLLRRTKPSELVDYRGIKNSNKTKAAATLEADFGTFDAWSRTLYITGQTVGRFTSSTPAEKWQHMERVVDAVLYRKAIDYLVGEADTLRHGLNLAQGASKPAEWACTRALQAFVSYQAAHRVVEGGPNTEAAAKAVTAARVHVEQAQALAAGERTQLLKVTDDLTTFNDSGELEKATNSYRNAPEAERCFVCNQTMPSPIRESLSESIRTLQRERQTLMDSRNLAMQKTYQADRAVEVEKAKLESAIANLHLAESSDQLFQNHEAVLASAVSDYFLADELYVTEIQKTDKLKADHDLLTVAKSVVEIARVKYMHDHALQIARVANDFLQAIGAKHAIRMVLEKGKLEITVSGTGARSYADCSSGEQRRIDICILLAMSQVAAASGNITASTPMIIDEALDTLDSDGVEALLLLACQIGKTRQVIMVSHAAHPLPQGSDIQTIQM